MATPTIQSADTQPIEPSMNSLDAEKQKRKDSEKYNEGIHFATKKRHYGAKV